jgi:hypothetical protein
LRAVRGSTSARNQVQRPPSAMAASGFITRPSAIAMWQPACTATRAAASLVTMPPEE